MLTILAVGEDLDLLRSRAEVLHKTGANVLCSTGAAALKFMSEWEFDLVVLGHSVRKQDAKQIGEVAHRYGSKTLVLLLVSDRMHEHEYDGVQLDARSFPDPACLIRSATGLLDIQKSRRRSAQSANMGLKPSAAKKKPASYPADISVRRALIQSFEGRNTG